MKLRIIIWQPSYWQLSHKIAADARTSGWKVDEECNTDLGSKIYLLQREKSLEWRDLGDTTSIKGQIKPMYHLVGYSQTTASLL